MSIPAPASAVCCRPGVQATFSRVAVRCLTITTAAPAAAWGRNAAVPQRTSRMDDGVLELPTIRRQRVEGKGCCRAPACIRCTSSWRARTFVTFTR